MVERIQMVHLSNSTPEECRKIAESFPGVELWYGPPSGVHQGDWSLDLKRTPPEGYEDTLYGIWAHESEARKVVRNARTS